MNAVVVHKVPKLAVLRESDPDGLVHLQERDTEAFSALTASAERQERSLALVEETLAKIGWTTEISARGDFLGPRDDTDLVVAVGGDGTVLDVSHRVLDVPLIGVNSDPELSVGYFCASDAEGFAEKVAQFVADRADVFTLHRIGITVNGVGHPFPCLNDLLVANHNPAMMSRYTITAGKRSEQHASSGLWISTPAGSTGGIRSAGGTVMPLEGALLQYLVREPYQRHRMRYELLRGVRHLGEGLAIQSLMPAGRVYVDGPYLEIPFGLGDEIVLSEGPPLCVVGMDPALRER